MSSDGNLPSNSNSRRTIRQLIDQLNNQLSGSAADNLQVRESVQDINQSLRPNPPRSSAQENQLQNAQQPTSSASLTASLNVNPAISEHRRLFSRQSRIQPYRRQNGRSSSRTASRGKTITKSIFCLARKDQTQVSSASEKLQLHENGLGEKRISFPSTASSGEVKDILYKHYPVLKYVGGMQLLLSKESARKELHVVSHGCCNAEQLKCFGTGRVYIRPLQKDIPLEKNDNTDVQFEECLSCQALIAINEMQEHLKQLWQCELLTEHK
ncbi:uncharacterized protein LOC114524163 [Dendronephthya gigantea]|uniref:uncharacterized protein LOC114524163 n=1 Tax=Dendronephthya gigantea TaxID=151771 RepID=UPI00106CE653|nr:uncharacterized protein LOC114524163 [Dendronephthya gigantea]